MESQYASSYYSEIATQRHLTFAHFSTAFSMGSWSPRKTKHKTRIIMPLEKYATKQKQTVDKIGQRRPRMKEVYPLVGTVT